MTKIFLLVSYFRSKTLHQFWHNLTGINVGIEKPRYANFLPQYYVHFVNDYYEGAKFKNKLVMYTHEYHIVKD
jgi:hypothetical protein